MGLEMQSDPLSVSSIHPHLNLICIGSPGTLPLVGCFPPNGAPQRGNLAREGDPAVV